MALTIAIVTVTAMVLFAALVGFALYSKGNVRATGRFRSGSFSLEAEERRR
jgi:hypothetical protein